MREYEPYEGEPASKFWEAHGSPAYVEMRNKVFDMVLADLMRREREREEERRREARRAMSADRRP